MADNNIWIFAEQKDRVLNPVVFELLSKGQELANYKGVKLSAVLIGHGIKELSSILGCYGADQVLLVDHPLLKDYTSDGYCPVFTEAISQHDPSVVLIGATTNGRDLAPRLAAKLGVGLTADLVDIKYDTQDRLVQIRPAYGGTILASIVTNSKPVIASIRPKTFSKAQPRDDHSTKTIELPVNISESGIRTCIKGLDQEEEVGVSVEQADIVVAGGRGLGSQENLQIISNLAEVVGGAVGGSRPIVDLGWLPQSKQIGQSGTTISPKLYISVGISGAIQHLIGIRTSEVIVAINTDAEAPIFSVADFGIVGDLFKILPALTQRIKEVKKAKQGS